MALTNKAEIIKFCNEINKKEGSGTIYTIDSEYANLKINRWSTGIEDLDAIIGGGMPEGRVVEIFGAEGSGKTTLLYHLMSMHSICLDIPIEGCVDKDTEFFNGKQWKKISEYEEGEKVLQYNEDGTATLELPDKYHKKQACQMWHVTCNRLDMVLSEYHNVVYQSLGTKEPKIKSFHDIRLKCERNKEGFNGNIPKTFSYSQGGINLTDDAIRLMVAVFADGSFTRTQSGQCYVGLRKQRKIERLKGLLERNGIEYRTKENGKTLFFIFYAPLREKHYPQGWYQMTNKQLAVVIDEMQYWDGWKFPEGSTQLPGFTTTCKEDADFIQFAYTALGYAAYITTRDTRGKETVIEGHLVKVKKIAYNVCSGSRSDKASMRRLNIKPFETEDGLMYCFTTKSKMWVMRRNDKICVTGNTFDAVRAKVFGNKPKQMLVYRAKYGEDAMNKTIRFSKAGIPLIGIDSVPSLIPKDDAEKVLKSAARDSIEEQRIGGTARLLNKYLPVIEEIIEVTGTTLIFTNQVRDKMQAMMFGEKTDTPGGHKLKHACSLRIAVARRAWIEIPNKNPSNSAKTEKVGFIMKCKVQKSKVCNPLGECEIPCFFDRGFVSFDEVKSIRAELMAKSAKAYGKRSSKVDLDDYDDEYEEGGDWEDGEE